MLETCSVVCKVLIEMRKKDRIIHEFPQPYNPDCTPYDEYDFSETAKNLCLNFSPIIINTLKICKVIVLGDVAVGKTSLVNRFCHQEFDKNYKATIGVDFEVERFDILNIPFNVQIWDTAGQERFKCIAQSYYRSAHVVLLVFDLCNLMTLSNCKNWLDEALKATVHIPYIFLVGTKKDLLGNIVYNGIERHITKIAKELNAEFWAVSAKTGDGVQELFKRMAALGFNDILEQEKEILQTIKIGSELSPRRKTKWESPKRPASCANCS